MADLKTLCIDSECLDIPQGGQILQAGKNIEIADDVINSLIQSGTNITVGSDGKVSLIASPALTGTPTAPTNGTASTSNTQIATTAFVQNAINRRLPKSQVESSMSQFTIATASYVYKPIYNASAAGELFLHGVAEFSSNTTGYRLAGFQMRTSSSDSWIWSTRDTRVPVNNGATLIPMSRAFKLAAGASVQAVFWQNSGSSLTVGTHVFTGYFIPY